MLIERYMIVQLYGCCLPESEFIWIIRQGLHKWQLFFHIYGVSAALLLLERAVIKSFQFPEDGLRSASSIYSWL